MYEGILCKEQFLYVVLFVIKKITIPFLNKVRKRYSF
ncbi:hypothetical protein CKL83_12520 [Bacillus anthracis]|uniref:Uncharacterized protein n=5 Tax=Bacillus cereus group TaxID=86661 RepID=A0A0F7R913_BACAN|nr:hypothetical protein BA_3579 [Bacillus anthracis str. Ames]AAT32688.1 hypothetical protein GBAA_3579 [Bacillus anthracis str. 'Ames Ancestor']AIM07311.1 hypothetical protein BACvac02_3687 [Bacillus anthracis]ARZ63577.1 hypothetical protein B7P25_17970 [Bacillus thuringiensis]AUD21682.1 hypothetical protein CU648_03840 [Bacillus sp. HBCD-sjtu]EDR17465.1 hypothetical protein BAC_3593 [Bacillus anthracis str. A0488]EDR90207.1 hypothetical protein BAQ_3613 [Bacillus anthracis str. A0193]EDR94